MINSSGQAPVPVGTRATVLVPATSANLGPGFDSVGLALDRYDHVSATVTASGVEVDVSGEGESDVPRDGSHLVVRVIRHGLAELGCALSGLHLVATNTIPHGRGLGSSAAAIVAGLGLAWGLARPDTELDREWLLAQAAELEGHPDNVAAAVFGGYTIAWYEDPGQQGVGTDLVGPAVAVSLPVHADLGIVALVPDQSLATRQAREVLPTQVPFAEAVATAGRAALLTHAITTAPELLGPATRDWLHQAPRATQFPESASLLAELREAGHAAVISGAGPTVLVVGPTADMVELADVRHPGFVASFHRAGSGLTLAPESVPAPG
ncbi:homoserine kinase [Propionibacteriaceae bacterium Y2011]|uniref:homoserine kinase n=1 Tax=Microlunatus sp. Y2014 TaxID=3418488 RepID=UPI003B488E65